MTLDIQPACDDDRSKLTELQFPIDYDSIKAGEGDFNARAEAVLFETCAIER
jgi:hypothetical protein